MKKWEKPQLMSETLQNTKEEASCPHVDGQETKAFACWIVGCKHYCSSCKGCKNRWYRPNTSILWPASHKCTCSVVEPPTAS